MKRFLCNNLLFFTYLFFILALASWVVMTDDNYLVISVAGFSFFAILFILFLYLKTKRKPVAKGDDNKKVFDNTTVEISDAAIIFPYGYYFWQSSIYKSRRIEVDQINELWISTHSFSVVINNNEVVFLRTANKEQLVLFANANKIPVSERVDIWSLLLDEFLDTEFSEAEKMRSLEILDGNGIPREEVTQIKRKVGVAMLARTYFSWEWVYYGLADYLDSTVLTEQKYWWAMEIALRNYKPQ